MNKHCSDCDYYESCANFQMYCHFYNKRITASKKSCKNFKPTIMTRNEAMEAVKLGQKVRHKYFSKSEFVTVENGKFIDEEGTPLIWVEFWEIRTGGFWETDWEIVY